MRIANVILGSVGEGDFAVPDDKAKLAPLLAAALKRKMVQALTAADFVGYRILRNLQSVHLRGLDVEPTLDLIPGFVPTADDSASIVDDFFHQNGFARINEVDNAGFTPLHYAALDGDPQLIKALIEQRADVSKTTRNLLMLSQVGNGGMDPNWLLGNLHWDTSTNP